MASRDSATQLSQSTFLVGNTSPPLMPLSSSGPFFGTHDKQSEERLTRWREI